ncbi:DUF5071 domain-containing protein [Brevibacillus sp. SYSU BS000544]|uniref:DUF5071 domain-containing protein n=1 Tax=Brevibacillus sp. SYSU BS000544 TaxID=3416443 RepID=UPI003CE55A9F
MDSEKKKKLIELNESKTDSYVTTVLEIFEMEDFQFVKKETTYDYSNNKMIRYVAYVDFKEVGWWFNDLDEAMIGALVYKHYGHSFSATNFIKRTLTKSPSLLDLIPKDKMDTETVERLLDLDSDQLQPVIPELMEWMQNINWPVAQILPKILLKCGKRIIPELKRILNSGDDTWQFACIGWIIKELPNEVLIEIVPELRRLAFNPSANEKEWEFDQEAKELLARLNDM